MWRRLLLLLAACGSTMSCGPTSSMPPPEPPVTYEADLKPIVDARCAICHDGKGIAPFALTTYDEVQVMRVAVRSAVEARRMPPYRAARGCADYQYDLSLTDEQIALFGKWVDQGALRGEPGTATQQLEVPPTGGLPRVDRTLGLPAPYTVQNSPDDYRCFVIDWPESSDKFVTGFRVKPGNDKVVHHVIAYLAAPERVADVTALDAADPGDGYACFGGPGGGVREWIGAWAPGGVGAMYPAGTGLLVPTGSKVVLQVHYNLQPGATGETDDTRIELALEDSVQKRAVLFLWTNPEWVQGRGMNIMAHDADATYGFAADPTPVMTSLTRGAIRSGLGMRLYSASLHMHLLGSSAKLEIQRGDGRNRECLLDIPQWNFHWQRGYGFKESKVYRPGDRLAITCHWNNSAEAQPLIGGVRSQPRDVQWGEGTGDEMCLGVMYATEP